MDKNRIRHKAAEAIAKLAERSAERGTDKSAANEPPKPGWIASGADFSAPIKPALLQEAVAYYDVALELSPDPSLHYRQALILEQLSDFDAAIDAFEASRSLYPGHVIDQFIERCRRKKSGVHDPMAFAMQGIRAMHAQAAARTPDAAQSRIHDVFSHMLSAVSALADSGPKSFHNRPGSRSADFGSSQDEADPHRHLIEFAEGFGWALVRGDFAAAHAMLDDALLKRCTQKELQEAYLTMVEYFDGSVEQVETQSVMDDWPSKRPGDRLWVYVGLIGEGEHEAVTVVVAGADEALRISALEWGRP